MQVVRANVISQTGWKEHLWTLWNILTHYLIKRSSSFDKDIEIVSIAKACQILSLIVYVQMIIDISYIFELMLHISTSISRMKYELVPTQSCYNSSSAAYMYI